jgi:hypothetical protein
VIAGWELLALGSRFHKGAKYAQTADEIQREQISIQQVGAKDAKTSLLKDPSSARYEDVEAYSVSGTSAYAFFGRVNAKNGFGGYGGFERFVAGPGVAATEAMVVDFPVVWGRFCSGSGRLVAF